MKILSFNTDKQIQELARHIESLSKQIYVLDNRVAELERFCMGVPKKDSTQIGHKIVPKEIPML